VGRFQAVVRNWLGSKVPAEFTRLFVGTNNVEEGIASECPKARHMSESKSNVCNVEVVMGLLFRNYKLEGAPAEDIKVVTPYSDQLRCYQRVFERTTSQLKLESDPFPEVRTVDSMRGHQAFIVIYDLVVTCGDKSHGIGIVSEEFRAKNVATRATDVFIIVGSSEILTIFPIYWKELMRFNEAKEPLPYIVSYL
jgi:superfamily I DNA and/or RNA helicase